jgi:hypothetical protein
MIRPPGLFAWKRQETSLPSRPQCGAQKVAGLISSYGKGRLFGVRRSGDRLIISRILGYETIDNSRCIRRHFAFKHVCRCSCFRRRFCKVGDRGFFRVF